MDLARELWLMPGIAQHYNSPQHIADWLSRQSKPGSGFEDMVLSPLLAEEQAQARAKPADPHLGGLPGAAGVSAGATTSTGAGAAGERLHGTLQLQDLICIMCLGFDC